MNRRTAVRNVVVGVAGLVLLPSCWQSRGKSTLSLQHLEISLGEENLLGELVDTLLPTTDTAGGKALGLHRFVLRMVDDTYALADRQAFQDGLQAFQDLAEQETGGSFPEASPARRLQLLTKVNAGQAPAPVLAFYKILKDQTINGYLNSELVMTKLRVHALLPGPYQPFYKVPKSSLS